jgi:hypothetical protein
MVATLPPSFSHSATTFLSSVALIAGGEQRVGAGAGQHLGGERPERAGRAGDDCDLAADVEQREGILEEIFGHGELPVPHLCHGPL